MAPARTLSVFSLLLVIKFVSGRVVNVGDEFNFTSTCADADKLTTRDNSLTVATRINGVWSPGARYEGRIQHISASSVGLTDVNYNDGGFFEFFCGGSPDHNLIQLEVVTFLEANLTEGDPVRLQCHSFTAGSTAARVKWEKDGELLFELDPSSEETTFHGGLKVFPDWNLKGDVSVFWGRVKLEDRGDYICYGHDKKGERRVVAWRVTVKERNQDETTNPPPRDCPQKGVGTGTTVVKTVAVTVAVMGLLAAAFLGAFRWRKRRNLPPGPGADIPLRSVETERLTGSSAGSPVNGGDSQPNGINGC